MSESNIVVSFSCFHPSILLLKRKFGRLRPSLQSRVAGLAEPVVIATMGKDTLVRIRSKDKKLWGAMNSFFQVARHPKAFSSLESEPTLKFERFKQSFDPKKYLVGFELCRIRCISNPMISRMHHAKKKKRTSRGNSWKNWFPCLLDLFEMESCWYPSGPAQDESRPDSVASRWPWRIVPWMKQEGLEVKLCSTWF